MEHAPQDSPQLADVLKLCLVLSDAYGWSDADIAAVLQIDQPAFRSLVSGDYAPTETARKAIADLQELVFLLGEVFPDGHDAQRWLNKAGPALKGKRPLDLIRDGHVDKVVTVLATFHSGAFL